MQPDTHRCVFCECTVAKQYEFAGVTWRSIVGVALCQECNHEVIHKATGRELPTTFLREPAIVHPAPAAVVMELAREISMAVRA